jgi:hypothetical protein
LLYCGGGDFRCMWITYKYFKGLHVIISN